VGNFTCALGHLGALCESCDIEQVMGGEKWSNSDLFTCGLCSETSFNTIKLILISFYNINAFPFCKIYNDSYFYVCYDGHLS